MNCVFAAVVLLINFYLISGQTCPLVCPSEDEDLSSLKAVFILMRHGIRAPWTTYPLDPFANDTSRWPNGGSQLTDSGIDQAYNIGKFLKKRYKRHIKGNQKRAFLRSSAAQRCLDTLSIVAKKLWPQDDDDEKSWQPMIFSLPKQIDSVLYEEPDCHNAEEAEQNNLKTDEVKAYESDPKIQELYNFTAEKTGLPPNMYSVTKAFDCIRCEKLNNLQSPEWATPEIYERMGDVLSKRLNFFYATKNTQRLRAGPILSEVKDQLDKVISPKAGEQPKNIFLYATHDFKIAAVLNALGDPQPKYPPFAATLILELHKVGDQHVLRGLYLNQTVTWPYSAIKLDLKNCKQLGNDGKDRPQSLVGRVADNINEKASKLSQKVSDLAKQKVPSISLPSLPKLEVSAQSSGDGQECTFDNFVKSIADFTPVDWRTECGIDCTYDPFKEAEDNLGNT